MNEKRVKISLRISQSDNKVLSEIADLKGFTSKNCYCSYILKKHIEEEQRKNKK